MATKKTGDQKSRTNIYLANRQVEQLKKISERTMVPMSRWIRKFIDEGLKKHAGR